MKNTFDYIIAGGGCAGLSLAYSLVNSLLKNQSILIIDLEQKKSNDRTWCFWTDKPTKFDTIVHRSWHQLAFASNAGTFVENIAPFRYEMIRGADFYNHVWETLDHFPNVQFINARISDIGCENGKGYVDIGNQRFFADKVFDSCFNLGQLQSSSKNHYFFQLQHFLGWIVETKEAKFTPDVATLMDFRTSQKGKARFFYVLPLSEKKALVEYTIFSENLLNKSAYENALIEYINTQLDINEYSIIEEEYGIIPMTNAPFFESKNQKIIPIGIRGQAAKPTTGYAFLNIQTQVDTIVKQLVQEAPVQISPTPKRFQFYDKLLLSILENDGSKARMIFSDLFKNNRFKLILKFLNQHTSIWEEALIFSRLPKVPFLKALFQNNFRKSKEHHRPSILSSQNQSA